jgi:hypothetical protein
MEEEQNPREGGKEKQRSSLLAPTLSLLALTTAVSFTGNVLFENSVARGNQTRQEIERDLGKRYSKPVNYLTRPARELTYWFRNM